MVCGFLFYTFLFNVSAFEQMNGQNNLDCDGTVNSNAGCGITEWSRASYGPFFDSQGGGVFAMKWDENGIAVCEFYGLFGRRGSGDAPII